MASSVRPSADLPQKALDVHRRLRGKLSVVAKESVTGAAELVLLSPLGASAACQEVAEHPESVYEYTGKGNAVAIVSDGSSVLGLGDVGPEAALPALEGRCLLLKELAGIDAVPLVLGTRDTDALVTTLKALAPSFAAIILSEMDGERCQVLEKALKSVLVFHDHHAREIVLTAAGLNAGTNLETADDVLALPGVLRGALVVRAGWVSEGMREAASRAIALLAGTGPESADAVLPSAFHRELVFQVAFAVGTAAVAEGVARLPLDRSALIQGIQRGLIEAGAHRTLKLKHHQVSSAAFSRRIQERIGEGLVRLGFLTQERCDEILVLQNEGDWRLFGEIALSLGFLDFDSLIDYLRQPGSPA